MDGSNASRINVNYYISNDSGVGVSSKYQHKGHINQLVLNAITTKTLTMIVPMSHAKFIIKPQMII